MVASFAVVDVSCQGAPHARAPAHRHVRTPLGLRVASPRYPAAGAGPVKTEGSHQVASVMPPVQDAGPPVSTAFTWDRALAPEHGLASRGRQLRVSPRRRRAFRTAFPSPSLLKYA